MRWAQLREAAEPWMPDPQQLCPFLLEAAGGGPGEEAQALLPELRG